MKDKNIYILNGKELSEKEFFAKRKKIQETKGMVLLDEGNGKFTTRLLG